MAEVLHGSARTTPHAEASFKNGVLTVTIPKSATTKDTAKRIANQRGKRY